MPIKFRCPHCKQFLGISRTKAGDLTDCPTCGRTIRIPRLDGHVEPLPQPRLDLHDAGLANALEALATLNRAGLGGVQNGHDAVGHAPLPPAVPAVAVSVIEQQKASPLAIEIVVDPSADHPAAATDYFAPAVDPMHELAVLGRESEPSVAAHAPPAAASTGRKLFWVLLPACAASFAAGVLCGNLIPNIWPSAYGPVQEQADDKALADKPAANANPTPAAPPPVAALLTGHVLYVAPNGEKRPDRGARAFAWPADWNAPKLDAGLFLDAADEKAVQSAQAAIVAGGGAYAVADAGGTFVMPKAGIDHSRPLYWLVVSRHQASEGGEGLTSEQRDALANVFEQPDRLVGRMQHHFSTLDPTVEGENATRDVTFER